MVKYWNCGYFFNYLFPFFIGEERNLKELLNLEFLESF